MEQRKITVIETKNQRKSVIMSAATTLAELKEDLRANNIDYDGMTFFEGTAKVELKNDASVLPHDVPYKGTITNELVFMLTNTNKKIKSGAMDRATAYAVIKKMNLGDKCKEKYGKNFTMCKTSDLITLIENNKPTEVEHKICVATPTAPTKGNSCIDIEARAALRKLLEILEYNKTIDISEEKEVLNILTDAFTEPAATSKESSSYSDEEIDNMFTEMGIN